MCLPPPSSRRRLLTQLEAAKGSRSYAAGDGKVPATTKGPDGVIMYELHSRPEQEKFNESAKVKRTEVDERTNKRSSNDDQLHVFGFTL